MLRGGHFHTDCSKSYKDYCRKHYTDLAPIHNEQEHQRVSDLLGSVEYAWIGLFLDNWKWSDQRSTSFRYWKAGQPWSPTGNANCVAMVTTWTGQWVDTLCDAKLPFMCYKAPRQRIVKLTMTPNGEKDLNDPAMKTAILSLIEKKLRTQEGGNDATLRWREKSGKVFHFYKKRMMENDNCV
ncbi:collectin-12-like [Pygocentrus nattereri]|uniref:collectin-12-like n=1 Tax=Pygocentrus nattereri TaxID=42514 RepID=UPI00189100B2|nr:collectin-12-like [Pygocentrus nattereri]